MDYHAIAIELAKPAYVGLSDAAVYAAWQAQGTTQVRRVPREDLLNVALSSGLYTTLVGAYLSFDDKTPLELRVAVQTVMDMRTLPIAAVDVFDAAGKPDAATTPLLDGLEAAGLMDKAQRAAIETLASETVTLATTLGVRGPEDIAVVRAWAQLRASLVSQIETLQTQVDSMTNPSVGDLLAAGQLYLDMARPRVENRINEIRAQLSAME
jgi:hypothetical protein